MRRLLKLGLLIVVAAVLASCGGPQTPQTTQPAARKVLVYVDEFRGNDYVTPALSGETVTTATSASDFNTKLAAGNYDLAIFLHHGIGNLPNVTTLENYVASGGRLIFTDYSRSSTYDNLLQITYTGNTNQTSMTLDAPLGQGVTNPMTLTNPGYGTYSMGLQAQGAAKSMCTFGNAESCLVIGNVGHTAALGFLGDTPPAADGTRLWKNIINYVDP